MITKSRELAKLAASEAQRAAEELGRKEPNYKHARDLLLNVIHNATQSLLVAVIEKADEDEYISGKYGL